MHPLESTDVMHKNDELKNHFFLISVGPRSFEITLPAVIKVREVNKG